ncbi:MAG: HAMP domain-containing protein [Candidatus Moduliflexus flocculans]|nr:HAMP domain-containing protein [Candidatus Moduliflexus flocculans]
MEQLTSKGRTSEARLQDYVQRLQQRGVREISIVSNEEEVIASSNPRRVGVRVDPKRKDILITARLGEETAGGVGQTTYNLLLPIVVGNQRSGYILISMILDNFAEIARANFLKRLAGTVLIFAFGIGGAVVLAWTYTKPISQVVAVARRVAQGKLDERLPANRRDEIGEPEPQLQRDGRTPEGAGRTGGPAASGRALVRDRAPCVGHSPRGPEPAEHDQHDGGAPPGALSAAGAGRA